MRLLVVLALALGTVALGAYCGRQLWLEAEEQARQEYTRWWWEHHERLRLSYEAAKARNGGTPPESWPEEDRQAAEDWDKKRAEPYP